MADNVKTTEKHPASVQPGKPARPRPPAHLDSPLRTMFGLFILWGCLALLFWAYRKSDPPFKSEPAAAGGASVMQPGVPRDILMQPFSSNIPLISPQDAMVTLAKTCHLEPDKTSLKKLLSTKPRPYEFKNEPLYKVLHKVIADRGVGYAIQGKTIRFYDQRLEPPTMERRLVVWEADLDLSSEPLLIFPSEDSDIWFSVQMFRDVNRPDNPWRKMQLDLWKGTELQNMAKPELADNGKAIINMSTNENLSFQIERKSQPKSGQTPGRYHLIFSFQSFS